MHYFSSAQLRCDWRYCQNVLLCKMRSRPRRDRICRGRTTPCFNCSDDRAHHSTTWRRITLTKVLHQSENLARTCATLSAATCSHDRSSDIKSRISFVFSTTTSKSLLKHHSRLPCKNLISSECLFPFPMKQIRSRSPAPKSCTHNFRTLPTLPHSKDSRERLLDV